MLCDMLFITKTHWITDESKQMQPTFTFTAQQISKTVKQMNLDVIYMFPAVVFLWRRVHVWALIAAPVTNCTDFVVSRVLTLA